jgi:hypothetical protein
VAFGLADTSVNQWQKSPLECHNDRGALTTRGRQGDAIRISFRGDLGQIAKRGGERGVVVIAIIELAG